MPNWEKTKVYTVSSTKGLNINLKGREPHGIVGKDEYKELCLELVNKLRALRLPDGDEMLEYVDIKENVYHGPFVERASDIVLWPTKRCNALTGQWGKSQLVKVTNAHHAPDGIFMFRGDDIKENYEGKYKLEDLAPTFLHYLELGCPDDLDGRVAKEIFKPGSEPARREIKLLKSITDLSRIEAVAVDEESIASQLKALGYL
jgi:predicted AlkP superfamily phosphohydrolase/phosphomutase